MAVPTFGAKSGTNTFGNSSAAKTVSLSLGTENNRILIAFVTIINDATVSSITFNGVAMSTAKFQSNAEAAATRKNAGIYYLLNASLPSSGTYNLSVTPSKACYGGIACFYIYDAAQEAPTTSGNSTTSSVSNWTNSIVTTKDDCFIVDVNSINDRTFTPTSPQIEEFDFLDGTTAGQAISRKTSSSAGSINMGQTTSASTPYAQAIAAFAGIVTTVSQPVWFM